MPANRKNNAKDLFATKKRTDKGISPPNEIYSFLARNLPQLNFRSSAARCDFINDCITSFFLETQRSPTPSNPKDLKQILQIAKRTLKNQDFETTEDQLLIDRRGSFRQSSNPEFINNIDAASHSSDGIYTRLPIDERKKRAAENETGANFQLLIEFFEKTDSALGNNTSTKLEWKKLIQRLIRENGKMWIADRTNGKSIYILAKENNIQDYRKLIYTLRKINFPISKSKQGRIGNHILQHNLPLFNKVLPTILRIWRQEQTFKTWISYLKDAHGWNKSRVSKFITRRIKHDSIPPSFFETLAPSEKLFTHLINDETKIKHLFESFPKNWDVFGRQHTLKIKLKQLKELCVQSTETLLTAAMEREGKK